MIGPRNSRVRGFPFQRTSTERHVEVAFPKAAHTQRYQGQVQGRVVLFFPRHLGFSQAGIQSLLPRFPVVLFPCLGAPTSFVKEHTHNHTVIPWDVLGHPHKSILMSGAKLFHRPIESSWTAPSWETMSGTIIIITTFFSLVSLVAQSRRFSFSH